ncbi:MAG TPA: DUF1080 domain-containing protein [Phycisphaerae bacterium]|jgi:hypothetical protein|nr:DUF1080 domain-containing protein [Phycisphaerae bacterium]HOJ54467.1 DUF1080 domain-containing protein [Phycisphaerae bacterium]HOL26496.1 DUF1080 domain-containing protein [Phycisphaerae bacterium]HPP20895.1 DUF1080 domain-containing protein [Phycisphaerae bacterium]HPU33128.1 DUF1080 domain-containing protein [Phycisphaerae bacterium]
MRRILSPLIALTMLFIAPAGLLADEEPPPLGTLPMEEASEGWILLFDGQTTFGWNIKGPARVTDGALVLGGSSDVTAQTNSEFCCFDLTFQYYTPAKGAVLVLNGQRVDLPPSEKQRSWTQVAVHVEMQGEDRIISVAFPADDKPTTAQDLPAQKGAARTPITFQMPARGQLALRDIKLKPLAMKSLFNGKNLDGWYIVPGQKSKFTVTPKGELNIKDGGGEIQTEGQWADFILQLDVFSNGKSLNSGIFFRALPRKFWQGYEAQIRNEWDGYSPDPERAKRKEDRTKPHDIGTGGIYNRQPARKVVSNDKEWFTYTVLAHGNHIALWVNGYQTADYFDNDKDADTARKGRFLGKGAISLQGHDPTTDLSFRNIRLQELPPAKK